jgi:hypothetical protein
MDPMHPAWTMPGQPCMPMHDLPAVMLCWSLWCEAPWLTCWPLHDCVYDPHPPPRPCHPQTLLQSRTRSLQSPQTPPLSHCWHLLSPPRQKSLIGFGLWPVQINRTDQPKTHADCISTAILRLCSIPTSSLASSLLSSAVPSLDSCWLWLCSSSEPDPDLRALFLFFLSWRSRAIAGEPQFSLKGQGVAWHQSQAHSKLNVIFPSIIACLLVFPKEMMII